MRTYRIIPRLDIKGPNLVKGIHLEGLRVLGSPAEFAKLYYEQGADEILFMDVVASLYDRNSLGDFIKQSSENIFIPLTVGGGLRTIEDIKATLRLGADKVCLNTAAIKNPNIISKAADKFGSSTIVVAIEAIKQPDGKYFAFTDNGREYTGLEVTEWAKKVEELGAGELLLTSVDKEGTGEGFDIELINAVGENVNIPLIVHGGTGRKEDILEVVRKTSCDAVCASSIFHYYVLKNQAFSSYSSHEGNFDFLRSNKSSKKIESCDIESLKTYLLNNEVSIRL